MFANDHPPPPTANSTPSLAPTIPVDVLFEHQFKLAQLQQLQHLQSQIFQQQIALISGQPPAPFNDQDLSGLRGNPAPMSGLPTPSSSTELRPQPSSDYVSPMALHYMDDPQDPYKTHALDALSHYFPARNAMSAPSSMAFPHSSVSLPTDLDFDISPLTSPWLGAHQQSVAPPIRNPPSSAKRAASPSTDDIFAQPPSKRQSPLINPIVSTALATTATSSTSARRHSRASKSGLSTPAVSRRESTHADTLVADSPSPVEPMMPPPAPSTMHSPSSLDPQLGGFTPVTPSTIMNLGRLGTNKPTGSVTDPKPSSRPKTSPETSRSRISRRASVASPNLKAILPATSRSSPTSILDGATAMVGMTAGTAPQVRKTSHKAAEQKRRDSLKTTFDDLRGLLPPIPLPSDENFPDERIPPGALPPRGPPKAGGEGPNKAVSKLQLLLCGNEFIRQLKGRVERRDEEIARLRKEVARLRLALADPNANEEYRVMENDELDLERDLDAAEKFGNGSLLLMRRSTSVAGDDEADEDIGDF